MGEKTWEQLGKECRAKMRKMAARFASMCGQCKRSIAIGDTIVKPCFAPPGSKTAGSNIFWYCEDCGEFFQRGVDCGYLVSAGSRWLSQADHDAFMAKPDVMAWIEESQRRKVAGLCGSLQPIHVGAKVRRFCNSIERGELTIIKLDERMIADVLTIVAAYTDDGKRWFGPRNAEGKIVMLETGGDDHIELVIAGASS